jgi:hypothetical protein
VCRMTDVGGSDRTPQFVHEQAVSTGPIRTLFLFPALSPFASPSQFFSIHASASPSPCTPPRDFKAFRRNAPWFDSRSGGCRFRETSESIIFCCGRHNSCSKVRIGHAPCSPLLLRYAMESSSNKINAASLTGVSEPYGCSCNQAPQVRGLDRLWRWHTEVSSRSRLRPGAGETSDNRTADYLADK